MKGMPEQRPTVALLPEGIEIPPGIEDLETFRSWARSESFPERGRIDWVAGRIEVDMTPEDINTHGTPKTAVASALLALIQEKELGIVCVDSTRISSPLADLSAEPDILVLLLETIRSGRAKLIPGSSREKDRWIEIEGSADIVVEVISRHSGTKDRKRLRALYHAAGVREYWLVDARRGKTELEVLVHSRSGYRASLVDAEGFSISGVLGKRVRLVRGSETEGLCFFRLECLDPIEA